MSGLRKIGVAEYATMQQAPVGVYAEAKNLAQVVSAAVSDNNRGVYKIDMPVIEKGNIPKSSSYSALNTNESASVNQTLYIFNEDILKASPAISSTLLASKAYNDGFGGKLINRLINIANTGKGIKCKGFNIIFKDASGNQDSAAIETAEFTIQSYTGIGGKTEPTVLDLSEALRNNSFQQGLLSIDCEFWVNGVTQISLLLPKGYSVSVNFKWDN